MFSIKRVTELDVVRVVTESGPNPDYIIQDALTALSAPPTSLFVGSGWEVLALIAKSHLVRAVVLFLPCVTHVDRCLAAQAQTGVDPGRLEWQGEGGGGLRRPVPWQTASELLSVCASGVSWCLCVWFQPVSTDLSANPLCHQLTQGILMRPLPQQTYMNWITVRETV